MANYYNLAGRRPVDGSGIGAQLTQPQVPAAANPADPEQLGLWQAFRQKLASDPNLRMALLTSGINMMRTPEFGQNGFDIFADSATTGIKTLDQLRDRDRTRGNEDIDRTFKQETVGTQLGQADERITQLEERTDIAREGLDARIEQFDRTLTENARQFDKRLSAGGFYGMGSTGSESTGPERMAVISEQAFITSGIYPDTEQGRSLAQLRARGLIGKDLATSQDRMAFAAETAADLILFNKDMTEEEAVAKAMRLANSLAEQSNASDPATPVPEQDKLIGQQVTHPSNPQMSGTLAPGSTPGTYKIVDANGVGGRDIPLELVMQLLNMPAGQQ